MHTQRFPSLSPLLVLLSLLVTTELAAAQQNVATSRGRADLSAGPPVEAPSVPALKKNDGTAATARAGLGAQADQAQFALQAFPRILDEYRKMGNREAEAQTLSALASAYNSLHQEQKAVENLQSALAIWRELGNKNGEATALAHVGDVYRTWGFPEQAIHFYRDALKVYPSTGKKEEEAAVLNNLGLSFFLLRDHNKCISYFDQALDSYRAIHDRQGEAFTLTNLGSAYGFLLNDPHKSLEYFQEAVTRLELLNDRDSEANALDIMGELWLKLGKSEMAGISFQHALILFSQTGNAQAEASVRRHMSALGQPEIIAASH